jgi:AcrR family transcriptional regulator
MNAIATEAGVSRQSLYRHFPDLGSVIEAYSADILAVMLATVGLTPSVPGRDPAGDLVVMLDFVVSLRPEQRQMLRLVHARADIEGLERLVAILETRLLARWRTYEPFAAASDGLLLRVLWAMAGIVLDVADGVHAGDIERGVADEAMRRMPTMLATAFGHGPA